MSEVEIVAGFVAAAHGFHQTALGPDAVEDHNVDEKDENFNHDFDDGTDQTPILMKRVSPREDM